MTPLASTFKIILLFGVSEQVGGLACIGQVCDDTLDGFNDLAWSGIGIGVGGILLTVGYHFIARSWIFI
jgi:hypothetical protein